MDTITVNGETYTKQDTSGEKFMLVCVDNRGLTFVGHVDLSGDDEQIIIKGARCVICWGTSQHVAELAVNGPTSKTRLGQKADVLVFRRNLIFAYNLKESDWE